MSTTPDINTLTYRKGSLANLPALKQLGIAAYGAFATELTPENLEIWNNSLQDETKLRQLINQAQVMVCTDGSAVVGMAFLVPKGNPTPVYDASWAYIRMVAVAPGYQGRGIAGQLTRQCISEARKNGETVLALHTSEMMHAARHIYEKAGFAVRRELDPIFGKRYWLYTMEL